MRARGLKAPFISITSGVLAGKWLIFLKHHCIVVSLSQGAARPGRNPGRAMAVPAMLEHGQDARGTNFRLGTSNAAKCLGLFSSQVVGEFPQRSIPWPMSEFLTR
jgi:hypothetical protein